MLASFWLLIFLFVFQSGRHGIILDAWFVLCSWWDVKLQELSDYCGIFSGVSCLDVTALIVWIVSVYFSWLTFSVVVFFMDDMKQGHETGFSVSVIVESWVKKSVEVNYAACCLFTQGFLEVTSKSGQPRTARRCSSSRSWSSSASMPAQQSWRTTSTSWRPGRSCWTGRAQRMEWMCCRQWWIALCTVW